MISMEEDSYTVSVDGELMGSPFHQHTTGVFVYK
jgi:hypothetical protein